MGLGLEEGDDCQLVSRDSYHRMSPGLQEGDDCQLVSRDSNHRMSLGLAGGEIVNWCLETHTIALVLGLTEMKLSVGL